MIAAPSDVDLLLREHRALLAQYGAVQRRCAGLLTEQQARIVRLESDTLQLRALLIARDTALAFAREDRAALELAAVPLDVHQKAVLCIGKDAPNARATRRVIERAGGQFLQHDGADADDSEALEASLRAADLVICQTGCVSHDAYWRVQDHCKRTGKRCVLVDQPQPIRFMARAGREASATGES
ncbi:DUF2325 domain-containing protein [Variovorax sp. PAMC 28711]|uniref:DUF2325 domain-containing protein n=1 Tax=Variovorax sp. PAMC 28711 TaxID=1795631 RepID=UPI00078E90E4|nr:DUF2325 domain-containing protein [Variovorax sp. PAMC 28711]AMM26521.1 hypothetical protein AX767_20785 [Variovorax sp. PAMC 28711]